jgi:hypothetical protein
MAHLFSVRMTVSEVTAEVLEAQDALAVETELEEGRQPGRGLGGRAIDAA